MKKKTKYLKPEMEFDNALMGYKPRLPSNNKNSKKTKLELHWWAIIILIIVIAIMTFLIIKFG